MNIAFDPNPASRACQAAAQLLELAVELGRRRVISAAARAGRLFLSTSPSPRIEPPKSPVPVLHLAPREEESMLVEHEWPHRPDTRVGFLKIALALIAALVISKVTSVATEPEVQLELIERSDFEEAQNGQHGWTAKAVDSWDVPPIRTITLSRATNGGISGRYLRCMPSSA
ncbi:MAG TPA: hypothetical protein DCE44_14085 [Verrucomicrobiales bacterium]|nr:hypothetical protein [Verrucomicrobiales bacterium]